MPTKVSADSTSKQRANASNPQTYVTLVASDRLAKPSRKSDTVKRYQGVAEASSLLKSDRGRGLAWSKILGLGPRGRRFKSGRPHHHKGPTQGLSDSSTSEGL